MRAERPRPTRHTHPTAPAGQTRPAPPVRNLAHLQRVVGNQAVTALVVQRMKDPGGAALQTICDLHVKLGKTKETLGLLKTSALKAIFAELVEMAADQEDLYKRYARFIVETYYKGDNKSGEDLKAEIVDLAKRVEKKTAADRKKRDQEIAELDKLLSEKPKKKARTKDEDTTSAPATAPAKTAATYSEAQQNELTRRLDLSAIQVKLFGASHLGYEKHRASGRDEVAAAAKVNMLDIVQPLSMADIARAQASYVHSPDGGEALLLEKGKEDSYRVTMGRRGGQDIHQLGPYLPSGKRSSVEETMDQILKETDLNSAELARAIDVRKPELMEEFLKGKRVTNVHLGKIRAMRQLRGVEMDRGPEVAAATALEHRSAVHAYNHILMYPRRTPLGPEDATTDLRLARKAHLDKRSGEGPETYDYIPKDTRERALASKSRFLKEFVKKPRIDTEAQALVTAILEEDETAGPPSDKLIDAMRDVMRTPEHSGFGADDD